MTLEDLEFWSPALIWLRARKPGRRGPISYEELAQSTGMPVGRVRWLCGKRDWRGVDVHLARTWLSACFFNARLQFREKEFLRRTALQANVPFSHLLGLPGPEFRQAVRLIREIATE